MSELLKKVQSQRQLEKAWKVIQENGQSSKSEEVRNEIQSFQENQTTNIKSLVGRLSKGTFVFPAAKGVPIPKKDAKGKTLPGKIRPIVLADVESRIVQRSILEALTTVKVLEPFFKNPNSFGGIKKSEKSELSAVPAAISAVLKARKAGGNYVVCADITGFFTRIPKPALIKVIGKAVNDTKFMGLFQKALSTELSNMAQLKESADKFPTGDIGVAQGNSLSPLMGNIILHDFDKQMNEGDCKCFRYIDDFIIVAPTKAAAMARLKKAKLILKALGMELSPGKTHTEPVTFNDGFEFLGIEFANGFIRPAAKAKTKLLENISKTFAASKAAMQRARTEGRLAKSLTFLSTLKKVDGTLQGWAKHYWFCNDKTLFQNLDDKVTDLIRDYIGAYTGEIKRPLVSSQKKRKLLGVELLSDLSRPHKMKPFNWDGETEPVEKPKAEKKSS